MEGLLLGHVHILLKFVCYNFFFVILLPLLLSSLYSFYLCILIQLFCSMKEGFLFFHFLAFRLVWYQSIDKICCNFSSPILLIFVFHQHCWVFFFFPIVMETPSFENMSHSRSFSNKSSIDEPSSSYFLHHLDSPGLVLVSQPLTRGNYAS